MNDRDGGLPQVIRWPEMTPQPWRNGAGTTRELASGPTVDGVADWRVSIAEVTRDGPFSSFPGIDRWITLVDGPGFTLDVDGVRTTLEPLQPFGFDGSATTMCRDCRGPSQDLNVMTRRGRASATVTVESDRQSLVAGPDLLLLVAVRRQVAVTAEPGGSLELTPYDSVLVSPGGHVQVGAGASLAVIRIRAAGPADPDRPTRARAGSGGQRRPARARPAT